MSSKHSNPLQPEQSVLSGNAQTKETVLVENKDKSFNLGEKDILLLEIIKFKTELKSLQDEIVLLSSVISANQELERDNSKETTYNQERIVTKLSATKLKPKNGSAYKRYSLVTSKSDNCVNYCEKIKRYIFLSDKDQCSFNGEHANTKEHQEISHSVAIANISSSSPNTFSTSTSCANSTNKINSQLSPNVIELNKNQSTIVNSINPDLNTVPYELATSWNSSRKRKISAIYSEVDEIVQSMLKVSDSVPYKLLAKRIKMDMDSSHLKTMSFVKTINLEQDHSSKMELCEICKCLCLFSKCIRCNNNHVICRKCCEGEVRQVLSSTKLFLLCPLESCKSAIPLDNLYDLLPSLVVDILHDNISLKQQRESEKFIEKMQGMVICPYCSCPCLLHDSALQFVCTNCGERSCRYCKAQYIFDNEHQNCCLLQYAGNECLRDITKLPLNWDVDVVPFNNNFAQVDVPLDSEEGATIASFFITNALKNIRVVQIFRIQNIKLWEKYILKRKHIEDEIGTAELKEKFLFHGTKAENVKHICIEGFDIRVPTAHGAALGKGIYFSTTANYSEKFTCESRIMFLSRVICGWSQSGIENLTRPQYSNHVSNRMYDSCVDNITSPNIYAVFDNSQCYPEYLIHFNN